MMKRNNNLKPTKV